MTIEQVKVFEFDELDENVQEKILDRNRDINTDHPDWYWCVYDDAKAIGKIMGMDIDHIHFSGFSNQGDGAMFLGRYEYKKGSYKEILSYAPIDDGLHSIAKRLQEIQRRNFYALTATITRSYYGGSYSHENMMEIDVTRYTPDMVEETDIDNDTVDNLTDALKDFARWIYKRLWDEYEYHTTDDAVRETLEANGYRFTENGDIW